MLRRGVITALRGHLRGAGALHQKDLAAGSGAVSLPHARHRRSPDAVNGWGWQYVFRAQCRPIDPRCGIERRHHLSDRAFQRAMRQAVPDAAVATSNAAHLDIHSPPICSNPATISGPYRNY
jgi:hypothetical protein